MKAGPRRGRVLLVEDSEDDSLIVRRAFRTLGLTHELRVCTTGEEALDLLARREWWPDIVILDVNLPGLSGFEVLRRVKAFSDAHPLPVVILSASGRDADVREAANAGADSYLVKPIHFEVFVDAIREWNERWTRLGRLPPVA